MPFSNDKVINSYHFAFCTHTNDTLTKIESGNLDVADGAHQGFYLFYFFSCLARLFICICADSLESRLCVLYGYAPALPASKTQMYGRGRKAANPCLAWN